MRSILFGLLLCTSVLGASASAQEWSRFRGPNGSGTSRASAIPDSFGPEENLRWRTPVLAGHSSPVLGTEVVFLTGADERGLAVLCLARDTGALRWERRLERARTQEVYPANGSATPTPTTDGTNVYAFFPELGLVSFDVQGNERWRLALGPFHSFYGMASSPILAGDTLVLLCDQQRGSFLLGVDAQSGKVRWRTERSGMIESWTTPVLFPSAEAPKSVLVFGSYFVCAYSVASGEEEWRQGGFGYAPVCSPVLSEASTSEHRASEQPLLYACVHYQAEHPIPTFEALASSSDLDQDERLTRAELTGSGYEDHFGWLDSDADGFVGAAEWNAMSASMGSKDYGLAALSIGSGEAPVQERWRRKRALPAIATPLVADGVLYLVKDGGLLTTLDATSGKEHAMQRLEGAAGEYHASPIAAGGKLLLATTEGLILVLRAGAEPKIIARCELGEPIRATPAIGADALFVRTEAALYCFAAGE